eukprot:2254236-Alexandrium_andersonii.AAC.1
MITIFRDTTLKPNAPRFELCQLGFRVERKGRGLGWGGGQGPLTDLGNPSGLARVGHPHKRRAPSMGRLAPRLRSWCAP